MLVSSPSLDAVHADLAVDLLQSDVQDSLDRIDFLSFSLDGVAQVVVFVALLQKLLVFGHILSAFSVDLTSVVALHAQLVSAAGTLWAVGSSWIEVRAQIARVLLHHLVQPLLKDHHFLSARRVSQVDPLLGVQRVEGGVVVGALPLAHLEEMSFWLEQDLCPSELFDDRLALCGALRLP
jgi:hypothetical protein